MGCGIVGLGWLEGGCRGCDRVGLGWLEDGFRVGSVLL